MIYLTQSRVNRGWDIMAIFCSHCGNLSTGVPTASVTRIPKVEYKQVVP